MNEWYMNPELHDEDYTELMTLLAEEEEEDPFDPAGEDPVDLFGVWWE